MPVKLRVFKPELSFVDAESCTKCGGACCKSMPGSTHPLQWGDETEPRAMEARIGVAIASGKWTIDWWEGDPRVGYDESKLPDDDEERVVTHGQAYYVRPAQIGFEGRVRHGGWGGHPCTFGSEAGCVLEHDVRPVECRALKPSEFGAYSCEMEPGNDKQANAIAWLPFQEVLERVIAGLETDGSDE